MVGAYKKTVAEALAESGLNGDKITGVGVSSQAITVVPVDEKHEPLCNAISWLDTRAKKQAELLEEKFARKNIISITGRGIDPAYSLPKILWLKKERPEIFDRTQKFLFPMDFLIGKLTGRYVTDHTMASGTLLYDIAHGRWNRSVLNGCNLSEKKLPGLKWAGETAGYAEGLGVNPNCVVGVGAQDQRCTRMGSD